MTLTIKGKAGGQDITVTWHAGRVTAPEWFRDALEEYARAMDGVTIGSGRVWASREDHLRKAFPAARLITDLLDETYSIEGLPSPSLPKALRKRVGARSR